MLHSGHKPAVHSGKPVPVPDKQLLLEPDMQARVPQADKQAVHSDKPVLQAADIIKPQAG